MGNSSICSSSESRELDVPVPNLKVELYRWSSEQFRDEYAVIYTFRASPLQTCSCHCRVNCDKVLLTFHDCLRGDNNAVRVDMEFEGERDCTGHFVFRSAKAEKSNGSFMERNDQPGLSVFKYEEKLQGRRAELEMRSGRTSEEYYKVRLSNWIGKCPYFTYFIRVICDRLKGLDVNICIPDDAYDYHYNRPPVGSCYLNQVPGMRTHDVGKEQKQVNDVGGSLVPTQSNAILSSGQTHGNFNGAIFRDCKILVEAQAIHHFKGFHSST